MNTPESGLPALSGSRIDEMESAIFAGIARDRAAAAHTADRRGRRRRRVWAAVAGAAAVVVVAAVISPMVVGVVAGSSGAGSSVAAPSVAEDADVGRSDAGSSVTESSGGDAAAFPSTGADQTREVISTGSATVAADDVRAALRVISDAAVASGGFVESMTIGDSGVISPIDGSGISSDMMPVPAPTAGGWISVRVPSEQLSDLMDRLGDAGEVTASSISRQDVTEQSIDLQARITAAQASVARLTDLMAQATSVADLIAAESALSERQATLESLQQQSTFLQDQVELSALSVTVLPKTEAVTADPAGFGDGLAAGWNGLVATLNGIVVALGFLLPWLAVAAVAGGIVWAVRRGVQRRRAKAAEAPESEV